MPKFEIHVEKITRARVAISVHRDNVDDAISTALEMADADLESTLEWDFSEEPAELVRWAHGSGEN